MSQIETFEAMLARGQDSDMLRFTLGNAYFDEKDYATAITHLRAAVDMKPDYSAAWKVLGRALAANNELSDAIDAFNRGLAVANANGDKQTVKEITVFQRRVQKQIDVAGE